MGIDVAFCGICGTDLHEYLDGPIFVPPAGHPHPVSGESAPVTLGHEMSGVVYAVGEGVEGLKPVEVKVGGDLDFWVRDGSAVGLSALEPNGVGVFFLSEDEEIPAEDEDYSAFTRPPVQRLVLGAGCSGPANHQVLGHLTLALAERLGALIDFDGLLSCPTPRDDTDNGAFLERARALVASLPGRVAEISYDTGGSGR